MNLRKFAFVGAVALVSTLTVNMAHAGDCKYSANDVQAVFSIEKAGGGFIDGDQCVAAIAQGIKTFDANIDKIVSNKLVSAAFDSMKDEVKTNPEAKKLQDMYRSERAIFVNDYLQKTQQDNLPVKSDGKRHLNEAKEKMNDFMANQNPFTPEKVLELREKFTAQAKASIKNSL